MADRPATTLSMPGAPPPVPEGRFELGRYRLIDVIGTGGMGEVHRALDTVLRREVAIKVVHARNQDPDDEARLLREARALAVVRHPNVVPIYDVGIAGGQLYVVMPLLPGGSLKRWLAAEPRPWRAILDRFLAAGRGLAAAHAAGLVHRDFKPDNVLLGATEVQVADFGLARTTADPVPAPRDPGAPRPPALTRTDVFAGTLPYMAPEQLALWPLDARCDQFAFATALWESLYRVHPFMPDAGTTIDELDLLRRIEAGAGRAPDGDVPPAIEPVLRRALALQPEDRWPSVDALLAALTAAAGRARRRRLAIAAAAVVVAVVATELVIVAWPGGGSSTANGPGPEPVATGPAVGADASGLDAGGADASSILATACADAAECRRRCDAGEQIGCIALGQRLQTGDGIAIDAQAGFALFVAACDAGERRGCVAAAVALQTGTGVLKDAARAVTLYVRACELESTAGCIALGDAQYYGDGVAKDRAAAAASYRRACDLGADDGCLFAAELRDLSGRPAEITAAVAVFDRLCEHAATPKPGDLAQPEACLWLGERYRLGGGGLARDLHRAVELYQRGCDLGAPRSCNALAIAYRDGAGVAKDRPHASELFARACKAGYAAACNGGASGRKRPTTATGRPTAPPPVADSANTADTEPEPAEGEFCSGYGSWGMTCGGKCVSVYDNNNHCGGCNQTCPGNSFCDASYCKTPDGVLVNPQ